MKSKSFISQKHLKEISKQEINTINNLMQSQYNKSHYTQTELKSFGFKSLGQNVLISCYSRIYTPHKISIGDNVRIDDFAILSGKITLGSFVHIANFASITGGIEGVELGDFCGLSSYAKIYASSDNFYNGSLVGPCVLEEFRAVIHKKVKLTRHCHIGSHSLVLPGSHFEMGATLGAMSLNMGRKLKEWSYYFGNPAKKIYDIDSNKVLEKEAQILSLWGGGKPLNTTKITSPILRYKFRFTQANLNTNINATIAKKALASRIFMLMQTICYLLYSTTFIHQRIIKDKYLLGCFSLVIACNYQDLFLRSCYEKR